MITIFQTLDCKTKDKNEEKNFWDNVENNFFIADIHFPIVLSNNSKQINSFDESYPRLVKMEQNNINHCRLI